MSEAALFDSTPYLAEATGGQLVEHMSVDRRRTVRQAMQLAKGIHPLTGGRLHPDAAPHDDRAAPGLRCGNCRFRMPGEYPKCWWPNINGHGTPLRITHGPATDVRAWWPACTDHEGEAN